MNLARALTWPLDLATRLVTIPADAFRRLDELGDDALDVWGDEVMDERQPGESFCASCPDHEGCMTGYPCSLVKRVHREATT